MIVVDTSALVAVVLGEPELAQFSTIMTTNPTVTCAASITEAALVLEEQYGPDSVGDLRLLLHETAMEIFPVTGELAWDAHEAWRRFGKGRHPAALNYGDCFSYALAKSLGAPLLFKGNDFSQTDVQSAH